MVEPPDLKTPFENDSERAIALAELLQACAALERWIYLAANPERMTDEQRSEIGPLLDPDDLPEDKLRRWGSIFDQELRAVIDARNRAVHGLRLGDTELRGATWLAKRLLDLVTQGASV